MANRKLKDYPSTLYADGSPVIVDKMQLVYSSDYGVNMLQITFRNASLLNLYGLSIVIECRDKLGRPTADASVEYNYYGIDVQYNRVFGGSEGIVMEQEAAEFTIRVIRAEYADGAMFHGDITLDELPDPQPLEILEKFEEPFVAKFNEKKPKLEPKCVPEKKTTYWRCTCGRVYPIDTPQCKFCSIDRDWVTGIYPELMAEEERHRKETLEAQKREAEELERQRQEEAARVAAEEARIAEAARLKEESERIARESEELARLQAEEAERQAKLDAERHKRKMIRTLIIVGAIVIILVGAFFGARAIISAMNAQRQAEEELAAAEEASRLAAEEASRLAEETTTEEPLEYNTDTDTYIPGANGEDITIQGTSTAYVAVREGPGTEYEQVDYLHPEEVVYVIGQDGQWFWIKYTEDGHETDGGYVYFAYLVIQ